MKRLFYKCLFASFLICIGTLGKAQERWISFDPSGEEKEPTVDIIKSDNSEYYIKVTFHGMYAENMTQDNVTYQRLSFGGIHATIGDVGEPALPMLSQLIAMPQGDDCMSTVTKEDSLDIAIGLIYPFLEPVIEGETEVFVKNDHVYNATLYDSPVFSKGELQIYREIKNRSIAICPFKYYPQQRKLTVYRSVYVRLQFDETDDDVIPPSEYTRRMSKAMFDNSFEFPKEKLKTALTDNGQTDAPEAYDYLIIVGDNSTLYGSDALKDFCKWKAYKGFKTKVVSTAETGSTCESIKNYIKGEYKNAGIKYVLFIGDDDRIPLHVYVRKDFDNTYTEYSDYWYGCMDDKEGGPEDILADIAIGRFPTNELGDLENMIRKSIAYESTINPNAKKVLLVAHKENAASYISFQSCMERIYNNNMNNKYQTSMNFIKAFGTGINQSGTMATNDTIINRINQGLNIVNYRGHGDYDEWEDSWSFDNHHFSIEEANSLTNTTYPIVFSIACQTANLTRPTTLMESFMCSAYGAASFLGATEDTYHNVNNQFNEIMFKKLLNENIFNVGELNVASHSINMSSKSIKAIHNAFCYICAGDPALEIFTRPAETFSNAGAIRESHNVLVYSGLGNGYSISVVSSDGKLIDFVQAESSPTKLSNVPYDAHVVLSKHNYIPYEVTFEETYVQNASFTDEQTIIGDKIKVGKDVTPNIPNGNVTVNSGASLKLKSNSYTIIKNGFECKKGGELIIE